MTANKLVMIVKSSRLHQRSVQSSDVNDE